MIVGKDELFERIRDYDFEGNVSGENYKKRLKALDGAVDEAVKEICKETDTHLAFSGGVDSSLLLVKMAKKVRLPRIITTHTIASNMTHPDMDHTLRFTNKLRRRYGNIATVLDPRPVEYFDTVASNEILGIEQERPDNYYMLMKSLSGHTDRVVCGDVIDELMGGYYSHRAATREQGLEGLQYALGRLIPDHLEILDKMSSHFGIEVHLPYGSEQVMRATSAFRVEELIDVNHRKKPIYDLAAKHGVGRKIIGRKKLGLVSAYDKV